MDGIRLKASTSFSCSVLVLAKRAILFMTIHFPEPP